MTNKYFFYILLGFLMLPFEAAFSQCVNPSNTVVFDYDGKSYKIVKEKKKWKVAAACARSMGGYLVHVDSAAEQDTLMKAIFNLAKISSSYTSINEGNGLAHIWIGANDILNDDYWYWDGDYDSVGVQFWYGQGNNGSGNGYRINNRYHNWGGNNGGGFPNEPDDENGRQDAGAICLAAGKQGTPGEWSDLFEDNELYYIVEYNCLMSEAKDTQYTCKFESFTFPDGFKVDNVVKQMNHISILTNASGCDSFLTTTLMLHNTFDVSRFVNVCMGDDYTFPDNHTEYGMTAQVTRMMPFKTVNGCDSNVFYTVTPFQKYVTQETVAVCSGNSFKFPDNFVMNNITSNTSHVSYLMSSKNCDSTVTTYVTVNPKHAVSQSAEVCEGGSYQFPDGKTISNLVRDTVYQSVFSNIYTCDSVITTTVAVNPIHHPQEKVRVCANSSYLFPDGYFVSSVMSPMSHVSSLKNRFNCDSIITTSLELKPVYTGNEADMVCKGDNYVFPDGFIENNIQSPLSHVSVLKTVEDCDSTITTQIHVDEISLAISQTGNKLTAVENGATYQWIDCSNNNKPIAGQTFQSFSPVASGSYAVIVDNSTCHDTSECYTFEFVGFKKKEAGGNVRIYPNPTRGVLIINTGLPENCIISISDILGKTRTHVESNGLVEVHVNTDSLSNGMYLLTVTSSEGQYTAKFKVER